MTDQEAKFILQAYRANGADAMDATFAQALEQARRSPALADWLERQRAFDRAVTGRLAEVAPPPGLRESIMAGAQVSRRPGRADTGLYRWVALAASLAVVGIVGLVLWPRQAQAAATLESFAVADTRQDRNHGGHGVEAGAMRIMLSQPTTKLGGALPIEFDALRTNGCRTIGFGNRPVLEVCFKRNGVWFHCYVVRGADFPDLAASPGKPILSEVEGMHLAKWTAQGLVYVVVSGAGREALEQLL